MESDLINATTSGIDHVFNYDNIAIVVLMLVAVFEAFLVGVLLRGLLKTKDVLNNLTTLITILTERLNRHD